MLPSLVQTTADRYDREPRAFALSADHVAALQTVGPAHRRSLLGDLFYGHCYREIERLQAPVRMAPWQQRALVDDFEANGEAYRDHAESLFAAALMGKAA